MVMEKVTWKHRSTKEDTTGQTYYFVLFTLSLKLDNLKLVDVFFILLHLYIMTLHIKKFKSVM